MDLVGGPKPIEQVKDAETFGPGGDRIWSRSQFDPDGPIVARRVLRKFVRVSPVLNLDVGGRRIGTTREHPFYAEGRGWTPAGELAAGDRVLLKDGKWLRVDGVADSGRVETVYNLEVEDDHTYFVGGDEWGFAVWAHNADCTIEEVGDHYELRNEFGTAVESSRDRGALEESARARGWTEVSSSSRGTRGRRRGVDSGEPDRGVVWREEPPKSDLVVRAWEEAAPGRVQLPNGNSEVPGLVFDNPNQKPQARDVIKFDGIEGDVLIDRKWSVTQRPKQLRDLARMSKALEDNPGYRGRIEVPTEVEARRLRRILSEQGIGNIDVRVP